jgi:hypothetical protein
MPGTTIGTKPHGETRTVLSANVTITEQDGLYSLGELRDPYLKGEPSIVERLKHFLLETVNELNAGQVKKKSSLETWKNL